MIPASSSETRDADFCSRGMPWSRAPIVLTASTSRDGAARLLRFQYVLLEIVPVGAVLGVPNVNFKLRGLAARAQFWPRKF